MVLADAAVSRSRIRILAATASTTGDAAETTEFNGLPTKTEKETISTTAAEAAAAAMIVEMADLEMASDERMAAEETLTAVEAVEETSGKVTLTTIGVEEEEEEEEARMTAEHGEEEKLTELMITENNGDAMEEADKRKNVSLKEISMEAEEEERKLKIGVEMEVPEEIRNKTGERTKATEEKKNKTGGVEAREKTHMIKMEG